MKPNKVICIIMVFILLTFTTSCNVADMLLDRVSITGDNLIREVTEIKLGKHYSEVYPIPGEEAFLAYDFRYYDSIFAQLSKFDAAGSNLWTIDLSAYADRFHNRFTTYPNGSFIASLGRFIIKFDTNGNIEWERDFEYSPPRNIFTTETGDIIAVEDLEMFDSSAGFSPTDPNIRITKLDASGNITIQKNFGGSDYEYTHSSFYTPETGLIIVGATQSVDGDFAITQPLSSENFIACINVDDMAVKWNLISERKGSESTDLLFADTVTVANGFVYTIVSSNHGNGITPSLIKLDSNGNRIWSTQLSSNLRFRSLSILSDGRILANTHSNSDDIYDAASGNSSLLWFDQDGNLLSELEGSGNLSGNITPTNDGGFFILFGRVLEILPSPPEVSRVSIDVATDVMKFSKDNELIWQKTYDNYQKSTIVDMVFPTDDGKLIIE